MKLGDVEEVAQISVLVRGTRLGVEVAARDIRSRTRCIGCSTGTDAAVGAIVSGCGTKAGTTGSLAGQR